MWIFDLCTRQIVQENVEEAHRNRINGHWNSMVSLFDMASFVLALTINGGSGNDVKNNSASFVLLCNISLGFLLLSAGGFTFYNHYQRVTKLLDGDNKMLMKEAKKGLP